MKMKLLLLVVFAGATFAAGWEAVERIERDRKIEVVTRDGKETRAVFLSATPDALQVREKSGERSIPRGEIRRVKLADPSRRVKRGVLFTAIGAGIGAGIGAAVCPYCPNEGHGYKYVPAGTAVGAGIGALGFLSSPYKTVYKVQNH
jgi:hypothetical protein